MRSGFSASCTRCLKVLPTVSDGGGEGIRTPDPLLAKQVLSRLSYTPTYSVCDYSRVALTDARSHGERMDSRVRGNDSLIPDEIATLRSQ